MPKVWRGCGAVASVQNRTWAAHRLHGRRPPHRGHPPPALADIKKIVEILLGLRRSRLAERQIEWELTDAAKEHLAREGYDPVYGTRPLKRFLQRAIETPLSRKLISGEVTDHSRVTVEFKRGELTFATSRVKGGK